MIYLIPAIIWTLFFSALFILPGSQLPGFSLLSYDKLGHMFFFIFFVLLWVWGITYKNNEVNSSKISLIILLCGIFYGIWIESLQYFLIPGRSGDLIDILANIIGCLIGYWLSLRRLKNIGL
ncbi:MAG: VanZ family protein [Microscillaceae bacterium]|nr:VanZ family protein [Microscillaceae bacterium]